MLLKGITEASKRLRAQWRGKPPSWYKWTYAEKLAWRCLNPDPNIDYAVWVDKFRVKDLVADYFEVPATYLYLEDPLEISVKKLPKTYVMKTTHGWDMSHLVEDGVSKGGNRTDETAGKKATDRLLKEVATEWFASEKEERRQQREIFYQQVRRGILFEEFIDPIDYELQMFLFNGVCRFAMVAYRSFQHKGGTHQSYDENWQLLDPGSDKAAQFYEHSKPAITQPPSTLMDKLADLCGNVDHVRVDFFVSEGEYYFSEFTFTHNGGFGPGFIGKYDEELGLFWRA